MYLSSVFYSSIPSFFHSSILSFFPSFLLSFILFLPCFCYFVVPFFHSLFFLSFLCSFVSVRTYSKCYLKLSSYFSIFFIILIFLSFYHSFILWLQIDFCFYIFYIFIILSFFLSFHHFFILYFSFSKVGPFNYTCFPENDRGPYRLKSGKTRFSR